MFLLQMTTFAKSPHCNAAARRQNSRSRTFSSDHGQSGTETELMPTMCPKKLLRILTFDDKTCFWNKYKNIQPLWRPLATCWSTRRNWKQHLTRYPLLKHEAATMNAVTARERNICIKWTFGMVNRTMMLICGKQFEQAEKWTKMSKVWVSSADGEV